MKLKQPSVLGTVVAAGAALTIAGHLAGIAWLIWVFKPLTTALIAWVAWRRGLAADRYARLIVIGLVLSLLGDALLIAPSMFLAGLIAFLLVHLCYLGAFMTGIGFAPRFAPFAAVAVVAGAVLLVLWPSLPDPMRVPVGAYVGALGLMVAQAHARAARVPGRDTRRAAFGASLFLLSDALLAIDRFHQPFGAAPLAVLASYWAAQTLIALSIPNVTFEPEPLRMR